MNYLHQNIQQNYLQVQGNLTQYGRPFKHFYHTFCMPGVHSGCRAPSSHYLFVGLILYWPLIGNGSPWWALPHRPHPLKPLKKRTFKAIKNRKTNIRYSPAGRSVLIRTDLGRWITFLFCFLLRFNYFRKIFLQPPTNVCFSRMRSCW